MSKVSLTFWVRGTGEDKDTATITITEQGDEYVVVVAVNSVPRKKTSGSLDTCIQAGIAYGAWLNADGFSVKSPYTIPN